MKKFMAMILVFVSLWYAGYSLAGTKEETQMIVTATVLNGREEPSKRSSITARFDQDDILTVVGWSKNHHWIQVKGGETGTSWVWWEYLTETTEIRYFYNDSSKKVKIRKEPYGRVTGYLKKNQEVLIDKSVFGWGHCDKGWVKLEFLKEES